MFDLCCPSGEWVSAMSPKAKHMDNGCKVDVNRQETEAHVPYRFCVQKKRGKKSHDTDRNARVNDC